MFIKNLNKLFLKIDKSCSVCAKDHPSKLIKHFIFLIYSFKIMDDEGHF